MCLKAEEEIEIESAVKLFTDTMLSLSWCLCEWLQSLSKVKTDF